VIFLKLKIVGNRKQQQQQQQRIEERNLLSFFFFLRVFEIAKNINGSRIFFSITSCDFFLSFFLRNKKNEGRGGELLFTNFLCCRQWAGSSGSGDQKTFYQLAKSTSHSAGRQTYEWGTVHRNPRRKVRQMQMRRTERQNLDGGESPTQQQQLRSSADMHTRVGRVLETAPNLSPPLRVSKLMTLVIKTMNVQL
jgi:hypothetical protein